MKKIILPIVLTVNTLLANPTLTRLDLETNTTSLNVGDGAKLTVVGRYNNNTTKQIDSNIELLLTPKGSVDINGTTLTAKRDGNVTVQIKRDNIVSNSVTLNIKWVVDGHTLPPEPDPTVNNSTLLGIDSNDNGVRDDVERWIYKTYKDKHPIHIDIAMQAGKGWQKVLEDPSRAKEIHDFVRASGSCQSYYIYYAEFFNEPLLVKKRIITKYFIHTIIFNTQEREHFINTTHY